MLIYATAAQLTDWMAPTTVKGNATQLLRTASLTVREGTAAAYYAVDTAGMPSDPAILQAFQDATCAQAAALDTAGIDPLAGGVAKAGAAKSKGVGSARIDYADADTAAQSRQRLATSLCEEAARILQQAGLVSGVAWTVG